MKNYDFARPQFLGRDARELRLSLFFVIIGVPLMFIVMPIMARESHSSKVWIETYDAMRSAVQLTIATAGLFCAINAVRDRTLSSESRVRIYIWCVFIVLLIGLLGFHVWSWWANLASLYKPPWMGGV